MASLMAPPTFQRLSLNDFGRHLNGSQPQLTGKATAPQAVFNPNLLSDLVFDVLSGLAAHASSLQEDLREVLGQAHGLQMQPEDLDDSSLTEVVGYHQLPSGFSFYGINAVSPQDQDDVFFLLYSDHQGQWRGHVVTSPVLAGESRGVWILQALNEAFPAPGRPASSQTLTDPSASAVHEAASSLPASPAGRLFTPMTEEEFVHCLLQKLTKAAPGKSSAGDEEDDSDDDDDLDDKVVRALHKHGLPMEAEHSQSISFDTENILPGGVEEFSNGLVMWQGEAGGDWQWPVHFYIYVDGQGELSMYVPAKGNAYDPNTMEAYDNEAFVNGQLPYQLQADSSSMNMEILEAFGLIESENEEEGKAMAAHPPVPGDLFVRVTPEELLRQVEAELGEARTSTTPSPGKVNDRMIDALSNGGLPPVSDHSPRISFDTENIIADQRTRKDHLIGFQQLPNGLTCWGGEAGGDWQWPVFFIVYVNAGHKLRVYVPKNGNAYDPSTLEAYDDDILEDGDLPNHLKANHDRMLEDILQAFGGDNGPLLQPADPTLDGPGDVTARMWDILTQAAQDSGTGTPAGPKSTADCKALLEQHPAVATLGLKGPWKRVSKKGNLQTGVVRIFQGGVGWAKLLEKNGQLTLITLSLETIV